VSSEDDNLKISYMPVEWNVWTLYAYLLSLRLSSMNCAEHTLAERFIYTRVTSHRTNKGLFPVHPRWFRSLTAWGWIIVQSSVSVHDSLDYCLHVTPPGTVSGDKAYKAADLTVRVSHVTVVGRYTRTHRPLWGYSESPQPDGPLDGNTPCMYHN
jgi:hypothetical protein